MKKWLVLLLSLALLLPLAASAQEVVNVYNWEDYIDEAVLDQFEEETGIHVNYMRFTTNEDMMVSVRANPGAYDVIFPSEYCVERLMPRTCWPRSTTIMCPTCPTRWKACSTPTMIPTTRTPCLT